MAAQLPRQGLRRWGNSLGVRLSAAIAREAGPRDDQTVELKVATYAPMPEEPTEAMALEPTGADVIPRIRLGGCPPGCRIAVR